MSAYLKGARMALRDVISLLKTSITPGGIVGTMYGLSRYITSHEADIVMSLLIYAATIVTLQPVIT